MEAGNPSRRPNASFRLLIFVDWRASTIRVRSNVDMMGGRNHESEMNANARLATSDNDLRKKERLQFRFKTYTLTKMMYF